MAATYTSTFTQNLSLTQEGEGVSTDTNSQTLDFSTGPSSSDEEGMALEMGGDATAVGEDTLATAGVDAHVAGDDAVQSAYGSMELTASGSGDASAYAAASGYTDIIGDADHSFSMTYSSTSTHQDGDSAQWDATFISQAYALDIDGLPLGSDGSSHAATSPAETEPVPTASASDPVPDPMPEWDDCGCGSDEPGGWNVDGNLALFDISVDAVGENSFAQADLSVLTVEDQLSSIMVVVAGAIA